MTDSVKKHHRLSPSAAHRWLVCPGEPRMRELSPRTTTKYADEGTTAHWLADQCLKGKGDKADPYTYIGQKCPETDLEVTPDMPAHVKVYLDECRKYSDLAHYWGSETKFEMGIIHKELGGTCDFWAYHGDTRTLFVRDLKYGQGAFVKVEDNPQLLIYAMGAALELCAIKKEWRLEEIVECVDFGIVQPRVNFKPVRSVEMTGQALASWAYGLLRELAKATDNEKAKRVPGSHCRFCPALTSCPEQSEHASLLAQVDFAPDVVLPNPSTFSIDKLAIVAEASQVFSTWAKAAEEELFRRLSRGETHPKWKLVQGKKGNREWANPEQALTFLEKLLGEEAYEKKVLTPAKAEAILKPHGLVLPKDMVFQNPGNAILADSSDPRLPVQASVHLDFKPE